MFLQLKRLSREYLHTHLQICLHTNFQYTCKYENRFVDNFYAFTNDYAHTDFECTFLYISTNVGTRLEIYLFFTHLQMRTHTHSLMQTAAASLKVLVRLCEAQWISLVRGLVKDMRGIEWLKLFSTSQYICICVQITLLYLKKCTCVTKGQNDKAEIKHF